MDTHLHGKQFQISFNFWPIFKSVSNITQQTLCELITCFPQALGKAPVAMTQFNHLTGLCIPSRESDS